MIILILKPFLLLERTLKARLNRGFLSRNSMNFFRAAVALTVQTPAIERRQNRAEITGGLHARYRSCNSARNKIASSCATKTL